MSDYVDPRYRVNIFLDTNILADYILKTDHSGNISKSLLWLANCNFVDLMSSHFVKFELTEVLKSQYFFAKFNDGRYATKKEKNKLKSNWLLNETSYLNCKDEIKAKVMADILKVQKDLDFDFNDLELHKDIINPTCDICLSSRVSKEDSLVLVSSMFPEGGQESIDFSGLLSNDSDYSSFYEESKADIKSIFNSYNLQAPIFLPIKSLASDSGRIANLYEEDFNNKTEELYDLWRGVVLRLIREKNSDNYIGQTYKENLTEGTAAQCLFFKVLQNKNAFDKHDGLAFVSNDLSFQKTLMPPEGNYWCMDNVIDLPYTFEGEREISFLPRKSDFLPDEEFTKLREGGNYVFYHNER